MTVFEGKATSEKEEQAVAIGEFLLARNAEAEAVARRPSLHWDGCPVPRGGDCTCTGHLGERNRFRLARCVSTRLLVIGLVEAMLLDYAPWDLDLLKVLAVPYAAHADYQEEWKP